MPIDVENFKIFSHFESVVRAGFDINIQTFPIFVDFPRHLHRSDRVMLFVILDLEEVDALEVVHLAPGDPDPVGRHLPVLVHNGDHGGRVEEGEGVLEGTS